MKAYCTFLSFALTFASAVPTAFPREGEPITLVCETVELPLEAAAALVKSQNGFQDTAVALREIRQLVKRGSAKSVTLPVGKSPNDRLTQVGDKNSSLMIEPTLSSDGEWLVINLVLKSGKNETTSNTRLKNGDSLLLGTLESDNPALVKLVFLHSSREP